LQLATCNLQKYITAIELVRHHSSIRQTPNEGRTDVVAVSQRPQWF